MLVLLLLLLLLVLLVLVCARVFVEVAEIVHGVVVHHRITRNPLTRDVFIL